jgi:hypothetical protein
MEPLSIAIIVVLIVFSAFQGYKIRKMVTRNLLLSAALANKYSEVAFENVDATKEQFLTFVSQSREWAFEYIDSVQSALKEFYESVGPIIDQYENYGRLVSSQHSIHMDQLSMACQQLKKVLPQEEVTE